MSGVEVAVCGPAALRVTGSSGDRERDWRLVHHLARGLAAAAPAGYLGSIPTYESVLVEFDAIETTTARIRSIVDELLGGIDADAPLGSDSRHFAVPVVYGGEHGPDLDDVARLTGLDAAEVIRLHSEPTYTVRCLGSPGGSPMLDGPAFPVAVPRLASPRTSVPVGAVSVAGRQATLTPATAPGGWCVIGRTPLRVLDLTAEPPVPYRPGDTLRFHAVDDSEYARVEGTMLRPEAVRA